MQHKLHAIDQSYGLGKYALDFSQTPGPASPGWKGQHDMFNLGSMLNLGSTEPVVGRASTLVRCSTGELFRFLGENLFQNYPKWSPEVKELDQITPGPVQLGTIGRQVRIDHGRRTESRFKISAYDPGERLTLLGMPDPFRCTYEFQRIDSDETTRLTFTFELLELLMVMRPMGLR
ncbi:MAG: SRPBCC family protein [Nitrosomonas sp.]